MILQFYRTSYPLSLIHSSSNNTVAATMNHGFYPASSWRIRRRREDRRRRLTRPVRRSPEREVRQGLRQV